MHHKHIVEVIAYDLGKIPFLVMERMEESLYDYLAGAAGVGSGYRFMNGLSIINDICQVSKTNPAGTLSGFVDRLVNDRERDRERRGGGVAFTQ